jgi:hypothetical protein
MDMITLEVVSEVNAVSLQQFLRDGHGVLPYPGSELANLDLWYACNLEASAASEQPPLVSRLADAIVGGQERPWKGRFAAQVLLNPSAFSFSFCLSWFHDHLPLCHSFCPFLLSDPPQSLT